MYRRNPGDESVSSAQRRLIESGELSDYVALAFAAGRRGQDPVPAGWQLRIVLRSDDGSSKTEHVYHPYSGEVVPVLATPPGAVDVVLGHGYIVLRAHPDGRVSRLYWSGNMRQGYGEITESEVIKVELHPPILSVMESLREGDRIYVAYTNGSRVVDVLNVSDRRSPGETGVVSPSARLIVYTSTAGATRTRMGSMGGTLELWTVRGNGTPTFQPTMNVQPEQVQFLEKVSKGFKKPRRKPPPSTAIRLGTKRSRELFRGIVSASSHNLRNGFSAEPIDPAWARENLEREAMRSLKSIRQTGPNAYTIRYHSNHWIDFTTATPDSLEEAFPVASEPHYYVPEAPPLYAPTPDQALEEVFPDVGGSYHAPLAPPHPGMVDEELAARAAAYDERMEDKRDRLLDRAQRQRALSVGAARQARQTASFIPMGQPILVGHHSERRHRRDLERIQAGFQKSIDAQEHADSLERAAARIGTGGISSDDPMAVHKLEAELEQSKAAHAEAKKVNAQLRKLAKGKAKSVALHMELIERLDTSEGMKAQLRSYARAFPWLPQLDMGLATARTKRIQERIATLQREQVRPELAEPVQFDGFEMTEDRDLNRLQLVFSGKPGEKTRAALKRSGFKWSPRNGAWQRQLNEAARRAARRVAEEITGHGGVKTNPKRSRAKRRRR